MLLEWSHITADYDLKIARSRDGQTTVENEQVASPACNLAKGAG